MGRNYHRTYRSAIARSRGASEGGPLANSWTMGPGSTMEAPKLRAPARRCVCVHLKMKMKKKETIWQLGERKNQLCDASGAQRSTTNDRPEHYLHFPLRNLNLRQDVTTTDHPTPPMIHHITN